MLTLGMILKATKQIISYETKGANGDRRTEADCGQRFQRQKDTLRAQGKCWQCARPIKECKCHNLRDAKEGEGNEL